MTALKNQAIQIALTGNFQEAAKLNIEILKETPRDTEALNRLAFALSALGNKKEAQKAYEKVLSIDPLNPIADRGIKRLVNQGTTQSKPTQLVGNMFLEESGKTKIVTLLNTAQIEIIRNLQIGQSVTLCKKRMKIFVQDSEKQYLGVLPDDLAKRLIKFIDGGNIYASYIKSANDHGITIFIKETKRANKFKNQLSFLFGDKTRLSINKSSAKYSHVDEDGE